MTTSRSISARLTSLVGALCAVALMATASPAGALPIATGTGTTPPPNPGPVASFTMTPNPAIVTTQPLAIATRSVALAPGAASAISSITPFGHGDTVVLTASPGNTDDPISSYAWDLDGDGSYETSGPSARVESRRYYRTGSFAIRLRVTDVHGVSSTTSRTLIVHHAPTAAIATQNPTTGVPGEEFKLYPQGSTGDPEIARYEWDVNGDGVPDITTSFDEPIPAKFQTAGKHTVTLTVVDTYGATATASIVLTIEQPPTPAFTDAPSPAFIGEPVHFDASASTDSDGSIVDYAWDLDGDGTFETDTGTSPALTTTFATKGTRTIGLKVTDSDGLARIVTRDLTIDSDPALAGLDTTAPAPTIAPSLRLSATGTLTVAVTCPKTERACSGHVTLAALHAGASFRLGGGQTTMLRIHLSAGARRLAKSRRTLRATATTTDAAGNTATTRATVRIAR
jgi:PKD repeat protein